MTFAFSRALAIIVGVITVLSEVARRRQQLLEPAAVLLWLDDMLLAGFLLYGAWRAGADAQSGRPSLTAAWGFMCGLAFYSFFEQVQRLAGPDRSGLAPVWVIVLKALLPAIGVAGLVGALRSDGSFPNDATIRDSKP